MRSFANKIIKCRLNALDNRNFVHILKRDNYYTAKLVYNDTFYFFDTRER